MAMTGELQTIRGQLKYLVAATGASEADLMAEAVALGLSGLLRRHVLDAYLEGGATREEAVAVAGEAAVAALDRDRSWLLQDIAWGLSGA